MILPHYLSLINPFVGLGLSQSEAVPPTIKALISTYVIDFFSSTMIRIHIKNENINLSFSSNDLTTFSYRILVKLALIFLTLSDLPDLAELIAFENRSI